LLVVAIGAMFVPVGVQAAFAPRSFHDEFPLGRSWLTRAGGHYDEHLTRDVGALFLALALVSIWTWWRAELRTPVAAAWLVQGSLHLMYHVGHLDRLGTGDQVALVASLIGVPVTAGVALALSRAGGGASRG
jgi:hypothetical protein